MTVKQGGGENPKSAIGLASPPVGAFEGHFFTHLVLYVGYLFLISASVRFAPTKGAFRRISGMVPPPEHVLQLLMI